MGRYWISSGDKLANDEWLTPPWMLDLLGDFDLDPCAAEMRPWDTAARSFTIRDDGLSQEWSGRVWVNPPFGRSLPKWITKLAQHGNGIGIVPLRSTDTNWFHEAIWGAANAVLFLRGRLRFYTIDGQQSGPCPHASLLFAYGSRNAERLYRATQSGYDSIKRGKFLVLKGSNSARRRGSGRGRERD